MPKGQTNPWLQPSTGARSWPAKWVVPSSLNNKFTSLCFINIQDRGNLVFIVKIWYFSNQYFLLSFSPISYFLFYSMWFNWNKVISAFTLSYLAVNAVVPYWKEKLLLYKWLFLRFLMKLVTDLFSLYILWKFLGNWYT